jgi:uncharacterized damage-inducible protein DinB
MTGPSYPPLDLTAQWSRLNDGLIDLVDYIPDDKMNWSPREDLYNFRGILLHVALSRHGWLGSTVQDGEQVAGSSDIPTIVRHVIGEGQTKDGIKEQLRLSWQRLERFLSQPDKLAATYRDWPDVEDDRHEEHTGHWIAFHLLEHDVHHRADVFHYLALLGIEHPEVETP